MATNDQDPLNPQDPTATPETPEKGAEQGADSSSTTNTADSTPADSNDTTLTEEADAASKSEDASSTASGVRSADDTGETAKIQAEQAPKTAPAADFDLSTLAGRIAARRRDVEQRLEEKERHVLSYVTDEIPKPYYEVWKCDANDIFSMLVRLKDRHKIERSTKKKSAKAS